MFEETLQNLQGNENIDIDLLASGIRLFGSTIDNVEDNFQGLLEWEAETFGDSIDGIVSQLKTYKKNLSKISDTKKEGELKAEFIAAHKRLIAEITEGQANAKQSNKLEAIALNLRQHVAKSYEDILKENMGISKELAIEKEATRKRVKSAQDNEHKLEEIQQAHIISLEKVTKEYLTTSKLTTDYNKSGPIGEARAVKNLKGALGNMSPDFKSIGADLGIKIPKGLQTEITASIGKIAKQVQNQQNNQEIITTILKEYSQSLNGVKSSAILLALHNKGIVNLTTEVQTDMKKYAQTAARAMEVQAETNKVNAGKLEIDKEVALIQGETLTGSKLLARELDKAGELYKIYNKNLEGGAATLKVINNYQKDIAQIIVASRAHYELQKENQKKSNREEMKANMENLRKLQAQRGLRGTDDFIVAQDAKFELEIESANAAAAEKKARFEYLSVQEARERLIKDQLKEESVDLKTSKMNTQTKLKLKLQNNQLLKDAKNKLKIEALTVAESSMELALKTTHLEHLKKAGSLMEKSNRLAEKANKLDEAQNAARGAGISSGDLRFSAQAGLNSEQSASILGTRGAAMRSLLSGSPEDAVAFANSLEETNKQIGNGSRATDRLRTRMTELAVSAKNLGADLVDVGLDGFRTGFKQLLDDIGSGAVEAGKAWSALGLTLAKGVLDKITDKNIDGIIKDLTFAFTGVDAKSDAEKIASSNNHLIDKNNLIIESNTKLGGDVDSLREEVKRLVDSLRERDKPLNRDNTSVPPVDPYVAIAHPVLKKAAATAPTTTMPAAAIPVAGIPAMAAAGIPAMTAAALSPTAKLEKLKGELSEREQELKKGEEMGDILKRLRQGKSENKMGEEFSNIEFGPDTLNTRSAISFAINAKKEELKNAQDKKLDFLGLDPQVFNQIPKVNRDFMLGQVGPSNR